MNYGLAYAVGFHPWEDLAEHPPFANKLMELVAREEDEYGPPYGPALDLGTGSAVWGVRLAQRGGAVTGHAAAGLTSRLRLVHPGVSPLMPAMLARPREQ